MHWSPVITSKWSQIFPGNPARPCRTPVDSAGRQVFGRPSPPDPFEYNGINKAIINLAKTGSNEWSSIIDQMSSPIPTLMDVVKGRFQRFTNKPRPDSEASLIDESVIPVRLGSLHGDRRRKKVAESNLVATHLIPVLNGASPSPGCGQKEDAPVLVTNEDHTLDKVNRDLYKLARYAKAALVNGNDIVLLIQVVNETATYMRMTQEKGVFVLGTVGTCCRTYME
ncbi:MAG: hypothetical protein J3Q66DRAFT_410035 [Benniella sp.]|nr:MAG: hypothetical protein J3Q66DRAFT_410035 [Benniella sp.]